MNKKMDANFAFAILLLAAAIVGMYFWLDNANEEVGDITSDVQPIVVEDEGRDAGVEEKKCEVDADCVPATCCHATDVVNQEFAPKCDAVMCTMSCETVLDCGQGTPVCNEGVCDIDVQ